MDYIIKKNDCNDCSKKIEFPDRAEVVFSYRCGKYCPTRKGKHWSGCCSVCKTNVYDRDYKVFGHNIFCENCYNLMDHIQQFSDHVKNIHIKRYFGNISFMNWVD